MSIKHTPSPMEPSLRELRLCGAASFADRKTGEDEWKNRAKWEKGGKSGGCSSMPGFRKEGPIQSSS